MGLMQRMRAYFDQRAARPRTADIDVLLGYLPQLYPDGMAITTTFLREGQVWPDYHDVVKAFYAELARDCWVDTGYSIEAGHVLIQDPAAIARADLARLRSLLTYCCRGERFCDGHWAAMIEKGHVRAILERLAVLSRAEPSSHGIFRAAAQPGRAE